MATQADVRRIALKLPHVEEATTGFAFSVPHKRKAKGFVWVWMERVDPKKPRVANPAVVAIRVPNVAQKDAMISAEPKKFFTEPHYNGFPAVLARLAALTASDLRVLLDEAWRCMATRELIAERDGQTVRPAIGRAKKAAKNVSTAKRRPAKRATPNALTDDVDRA
jgi:hypothetical protein